MKSLLDLFKQFTPDEHFDAIKIGLAGIGLVTALVQTAMAQTRSEVNAALTATTTAVADALDEVSTDMLRRIRRLQLNQLLNLDL